MSDALLGAIVGGLIATVIAGITGFVSIRAERIRAEGEAKLDGAKRRDDRKIASDTFQRETLLAFQVALHEYRSARAMTASWLRNPRSPGAAERIESSRSTSAAAERDMGLYIQRVLDAELRQLAFKLRVGNAVGEADRLTGKATTGDPIAEESERHRLVETRLGELIRAYSKPPE